VTRAGATGGLLLRAGCSAACVAGAGDVPASGSSVTRRAGRGGLLLRGAAAVAVAATRRRDAAARGAASGRAAAEEEEEAGAEECAAAPPVASAAPAVAEHIIAAAPAARRGARRAAPRATTLHARAEGGRAAGATCARTAALQGPVIPSRSLRTHTDARSAARLFRARAAAPLPSARAGGTCCTRAGEREQQRRRVRDDLMFLQRVICPRGCSAAVKRRSTPNATLRFPGLWLCAHTLAPRDRTTAAVVAATTAHAQLRAWARASSERRRAAV
jgi:hypothetical protein